MKILVIFYCTYIKPRVADEKYELLPVFTYNFKTIHCISTMLVAKPMFSRSRNAIKTSICCYERCLFAKYGLLKNII